VIQLVSSSDFRLCSDEFPLISEIGYTPHSAGSRIRPPEQPLATFACECAEVLQGHLRSGRRWAVVALFVEIEIEFGSLGHIGNPSVGSFSYDAPGNEVSLSSWFGNCAIPKPWNGRSSDACSPKLYRTTVIAAQVGEVMWRPLPTSAGS
jgi:hypothetical protein